MLINIGANDNKMTVSLIKIGHFVYKTLQFVYKLHTNICIISYKTNKIYKNSKKKFPLLIQKTDYPKHQEGNQQGKEAICGIILSLYPP